MTDEKKRAEPKTPDGNFRNSTPKITRRRFTKAGAIAPVVMTLGSRPVWGACATSISGQQSGNDYLMYETPGSAGHQPSWWTVSLDSWPTSILSAPIAYTIIGENNHIISVPSNAQVKIDSSPYQGEFSAYCIADTISDLTGCGSATDSLYKTLLAGDLDPDAQAAAAMLNALVLGQEAYGYMASAIAEFICSGHSADVTCVLEGLNGRTVAGATPTLLTDKVELSIGSNKYVALGAYYNSGSRLMIAVDCGAVVG